MCVKSAALRAFSRYGAQLEKARGLTSVTRPLMFPLIVCSLWPSCCATEWALELSYSLKVMSTAN